MKVWLTETLRPNITVVPPLYTWPDVLKRIILILATVACAGAYLLLLAGVVGASLLWFS